ncbi:hypothetical protein [Arthrobacter castelli]|uniref:hypothetical protein n=1 Tax=Arthrobacter castelli TaxID=271431 RepID=UPI00040D520A|nr:hypothetical protein [Arthrobacter castelli]
MSVISPCEYVGGNLINPPMEPWLAASHRLTTKGGKFFPTFDIGYYHIFEINVQTPSYDRTEREITRKLGRFYKKMNMIEGFRTLKTRIVNEYIPINHNFSMVHKITYVIEKTGTGNQNPDCPYPQYPDDMRRLTFAPETAEVLKNEPTLKSRGPMVRIPDNHRTFGY